MSNTAPYKTDTSEFGEREVLAEVRDSLKLANDNFIASIQELNDLTNMIILPARPMITDKNGPKKVTVNSTFDLTVDYENFGSEEVKSVFIIIKPQKGFIALIDSIFIGNIPGGGTGQAMSNAAAGELRSRRRAASSAWRPIR